MTFLCNFFFNFSKEVISIFPPSDGFFHLCGEKITFSKSHPSFSTCISLHEVITFVTHPHMHTLKGAFFCPKLSPYDTIFMHCTDLFLWANFTQCFPRWDDEIGELFMNGFCPHLLVLFESISGRLSALFLLKKV